MIKIDETVPKMRYSLAGSPLYPLLRFFGSIEHDPGVAEWFDSRPGELGSIARKWFMQMRGCGADVRELVHDGCPVVCVDNAPFAYVNAFKSHVNVGFFHGASLRDPARLLEGRGKYMRHVKLKPGVAFDETSLETLITTAYRDIGVRVRRSMPMSPGAE
jgi:hypothetical protein